MNTRRTKKTALFVLGGGIGNIVQATPAIKAACSEGWVVDLKLHCNSSNDMGIFRLPCIRDIIQGEPKEHYTYQLRGPFTPGKRYRCDNLINTRMSYAQHKPEAHVYYSLVTQMGVKAPLPPIEVNVPSDGPNPDKPNMVAIYPGSKHNWAMKRWDKYDELASRLSNVAIVGTKQDVQSHGNPTWIKKPWKWPESVDFIHGTLDQMAYYISRCKMFIGNDGGLAHVAAATGVPTYVLFGPSSDIKNKPYAPNAHVVAIDLPCRPCQFQKGPDGKSIFDGDKGNCHLNMKCMREMSVDYVLSKTGLKT